VNTPRLLLLTPDVPPAPGGVQRLLGKFCASLARAGWDVSVVAAAGPGAGVWDDAAPFGIRRTRAPWGPRTGAAVLAEMVAAGVRTPTDIVLAGHVVSLPSAVAAARGRPLAVMVYGSELWSPRGRRMVQRFGDRVDSFIAISEFTRGVTEQLGVDRERITVARPGGDLPQPPADWRRRLVRLGVPSNRGDTAPFLVTLARLAEPHKGHDVVIRTMPALVARHPGLHYVIAGDGPLRSHLKRIVATSGSEHAVLMTAAVDEPTKRSLLMGCCALVMPSREAPAAAQFEGFGVALVEAAIAARPVIAGRSGAIPEVVIDGETGLLVDPRSPVAIADAVSRLLDDPRLATELGERARERALREFGWDRFVELVERELRRLI
jgi:phosphatidylinositol alpha-1,6-mannosyltransferase